MPHWNNQPWQRNLSKIASGKPGAVHWLPLSGSTYLCSQGQAIHGVQGGKFSCPWNGTRGPTCARHAARTPKPALHAVWEGWTVELPISPEGVAPRGHTQKDKALR